MSITELKKLLERAENAGKGDYEARCVDGIENFSAVQALEVYDEDRVVKICAWRDEPHDHNTISSVIA